MPCTWHSLGKTVHFLARGTIDCVFFLLGAHQTCNRDSLGQGIRATARHILGAQCARKYHSCHNMASVFCSICGRRALLGVPKLFLAGVMIHRLSTDQLIRGELSRQDAGSWLRFHPLPYEQGKHMMKAISILSWLLCRRNRAECVSYGGSSTRCDLDVRSAFLLRLTPYLSLRYLRHWLF